MRKLRKILLSTIFALTVSTTFFANTAGTQTVTAASGTAVTFKRKVIAYRTGSVYNFVPIGNAADNRRALNLLMEGNEKKVININNNIHIDTYLRPGNNTTINAGKHTITSYNQRRHLEEFFLQWISWYYDAYQLCLKHFY